MRKKSIFCSLLLLIIACRSFAGDSYPVGYKHSMVVTEHYLASQIGLDILHAGGNAIDATVAIAYALAVVDPCCGNIGGGGFMLIHLAEGKNIFVNFREKAPLKANRSTFLNLSSQLATRGYLSVAVPGAVLGLSSALQRYGTMPLKQLITPAIRLAQEGFIVTPTLAKQITKASSAFGKQPNIVNIFFKDGHPLKVGDRLVQTDLANTLKKIAEKGPAGFYHGSIAQTVVKESEHHGGLLSLDDFARYTVEELAPISCTYRGYTIISSPPPSSGGVTLCEMLNILENFPLKEFGYRNTKSTRIILETMRFAFADRNMKLGDPHFVSNPVSQLISKDYAAMISKIINHSHFIQHSQTYVPSPTQTTHFSVVDAKGNAVSITYTLNGLFGAQVIAGNTGFFLNDEMDDFATKPGQPNQYGLVQADANAVEPEKRPLSSMTPTIVMKDGQVVMIIGSPGGPRIITSVLLTILNAIDYGMNIKQAVDTPRYHFQGIPNAIDIEPLALSFATTKKLEYLGYHFILQNLWGAVEAIYIDPVTKILYGANDYRRPDGLAIGE